MGDRNDRDYNRRSNKDYNRGDKRQYDNHRGEKRQHDKNRGEKRQYDNNRGEKRQYDNHRDRSYRKYNDDYDKKRPEVNEIKVKLQQIDLPTIKIISANSRFKGKFIPNIRKESHQPLRLDSTKLGELKNLITPIQKLWTNYIKQYLNISEFVQIFRFNRSLAFGKTQYGKSIINYRVKNETMQYNNSHDQEQIFSRAYFKLWEILSLGVLQKYKNQAITFGCVAEGPGGFIHSLIDFREKQHQSEIRRPNDIYHAITLKIDQNTRNAKDWSDRRGESLFNKMRQNFQYKIHLSYGKTKTGDLLRADNIEYFASEITNKCLLVTGDGGIQCIGDKQFEYQEVFNAKLFFGQILSAFHIQEKSGTFILKIYDCSFEITRQLLLLLAIYYENVRFVKPITSRPGNSQKYILCENFLGISEQELQSLKSILAEWNTIQPKLSYFQNTEFVHNLFTFQCQNYEEAYKNISEANDLFVRQQEEKLQEGLKLAQSAKESLEIDYSIKKKRYQEQINFAYGWCKKYDLPAIKVHIQESS